MKQPTFFYDVGQRQPEEPTQVRSLLKETPIILPCERRASVVTGKGFPCFQMKRIRISTLEERPSVVSTTGAYSTLRIKSVRGRASRPWSGRRRARPRVSR